jgi:hypothetical protein
MQVTRGMVEGESTTEVRNTSGAPSLVWVRIPLSGMARTNNAPTISVEVTRDGKPLVARTTRGPLELEDANRAWTRGVTASFKMVPRSTTAIRVKFRTPLGQGGLDNLIKVVAYEFGGIEGVRQLNATIKYGPKDIFGLPEFDPKLGWKAGTEGAFLRLQPYQPLGRTALASFYQPGR